MSAPDDAVRHSRRQLLLVASLFLVPLAAAFLLYHSSGWRPVVNAQGTLVEPPRPLAAADFRLADGQPAAAGLWLGVWSMVHPAAAGCGDRTRAVFEELARVRLALDKDAGRVRRVLVHDGSCADPAGADVLVLRAEGSVLRAAFPPAVDGAAGIYIVDPHGNLMMSYPASGSARGLLKDLERLLRLSGIG